MYIYVIKVLYKNTILISIKIQKNSIEPKYKQFGLNKYIFSRALITDVGINYILGLMNLN